jgi:hypothetical protein
MPSGYSRSVTKDGESEWAFVGLSLHEAWPLTDGLAYFAWTAAWPALLHPAQQHVLVEALDQFVPLTLTQ